MINHNLSNYYGINAKLEKASFLDLPRAGSWGTPELGLTEKFAGFLSGGQSTDIGNVVLGATQQPQYTTPEQRGSTNNFVSTNPALNQYAGNVVTNNGGQTQPTQTSNPSRLQQLQAIGSNRNPVQQTEYQALIDQLTAGQQNDSKQIDEAYGASNNYLNEAENYLRSDFPKIQSEIQGQYDSGVRTAQSGKASTIGTINEQQIQADQRNLNVLADSRRLYDELRKGYSQRFGGASSAGLAASELAAVEQQRQQGRNQQEYSTTMRGIEGMRTQVESKYQDQLYQLEQSKTQALNEAQRDFQSKLLTISQNRAQNEAAKAQAKLSALQTLRNQVFSIQQQNLQFQQTLQAQKQQVTSSLATYSQQLEQQASAAQGAVGTYNQAQPIQSNLQTSTNTGTSTTGPYLGPISTNRKPEEDSWQSLLA